MAKIGKNAVIMSHPSNVSGVIRIAVRPNGSVIRQRFLDGKSDGWFKVRDANHNPQGLPY